MLQKTVGALCHDDYKFPQQQQIEQGKVVIEQMSEQEYIVRRLTPLECCRLQGFPDYWCDNLDSQDPTDEELDHWIAIFDEYNQAIGKPNTKKKSRDQIRKWLADPYSDSAMYKMWGNGVALPCVLFVISGIVEVTRDNAINS